MALPATLSVKINLSGGASFGNPFILNTSQLGFAELASAIPVIVDVSAQTTNISTRRGRNLLQDQYEAGSATIRVVDPNGDFNPQNTTSPYFGLLQPLRKIQASAIYGGVTYGLFGGYITEFRYTYPTGQELGYVDITCSDAFRLFGMANVSTVADATAGQTTGTRINKILDQVDFPSSMRIIDAGTTTTQADPATTRSSLSAIQVAEFTEQGAFYVLSGGEVEFKDRNDVVGSLAATPIEFNQSGGIPYSDLRFAFDDKLIINSVTAQRVGGSVVSSIDADSIAKYFPHGMNVENLIAQTDAQVQDIADIYVATRKETTIRIDAMTVDLLDPAVPTDTIIGLEYFDNVEITNIQPDGSTIVKTLQVQGLAWDITPNSMKCTVTTLEPIVEGFIIGSSTYGIIGQSIMGY